MLQQILMQAPYLRKKATEIYTVLAELYSNGLEHGVLGLDSELKKSVEGFAEYYQARAVALENVSGFVRFEIAGSFADNVVNLTIKVIDSGKGFDYTKLAQTSKEAVSENQYHGRGVRLLKDLCQEVNYIAPGNQVCVRMVWSESDE